ncbi:MAG: hypothetical protein KF716_12870 [Anaerolineae bacterium]|nr:hypothetical protein [Anaerolineae bacterium]
MDREESPLLPKSQAFRQMPWQRAQTQTTLLIVMVIVVSLIIGALYLVQATVTATTGDQLIRLREERDQLSRSNEDMESQIAFKRNLAVLTGRAQALGFSQASSDDMRWVVVDNYTRLRATATPIITPVPTNAYTETFDGWVRDQWGHLVQQFEAWAGSRSAQGTPQP